jgi:hypothetical protein
MEVSSERADLVGVERSFAGKHLRGNGVGGEDASPDEISLAQSPLNNKCAKQFKT